MGISVIKSKNKKAKTLNFELLYLVTGYFKLDSDIPEDKSLHLLPKRSLTLDFGSPEGDRLCHTNINGVIEITAKEKVKASSIKLRNVDKKIYKVNFPSSELLMFSWLKGLQDKSQDWRKMVIGYKNESNNDAQSVELKSIYLKKKYFRDPVRDSKEQTELAYTKWYDKYQRGDNHYAIVLPRMHAALLIFNHKDMVNSLVKIIAPEPSNKKFELQIKEDSDTKLIYVLLTGTEKELPRGIYKIDVEQPNIQESDLSWNQSVKDIGGYTLHEPIRFNISTMAGNFDMVNCDPITLEDAVLTQFPTMLRHIIAKLKQDNKSIVTTSKKKNKADVTVNNAALLQFGANMKFGYDKSKMAMSMINASGKSQLSKMLVTIMNEMSSSTNSHTKEVSLGLKSIISGITIMSTTQDYLKLKGALSASSQAVTDVIIPIGDIFNDSTNSGVLRSVRRYFGAEPNFSDLQSRFLENFNRMQAGTAGASEIEFVTTLRNLATQNGATIDDVNDFLQAFPEDASRLDRLTGKNITKTIGKVVSIADVMITAGEALYLTQQAFKFEDKLEKVVKKNSELYADYDKVMEGNPSREALINLEKFRATTIAKKMDYDKAIFDAMKKYYDAAVGVVAMTPTPAGLVAQILLIGEEAIKLGTDLITLTDEIWNDSDIQESYSDAKLLSGLVNGAQANRQLMPTVDDLQAELKGAGKKKVDLYYNKSDKSQHVIADVSVGEHYYHTQYRLRAEALYGLLNLLIAAALVCDEGKYKEKLDEYKIDEYIQTFILNDGWLFDNGIGGDIDLDVWWLHFIEPIRLLKLSRGNGSLWLVEEIQKLYHSVFSEEVEWLAHNPAANFQQHFPIHKYSSDSWLEFSQIFNPIDLIDSTADWVDDNETLVYFRAKDSKYDNDWKLINSNDVDHISKLENLKLSVRHQIRVLIVLKEKRKKVKEDGSVEELVLPPGVYPIALRVIRTDHISIKGPEYTQTASTLTKSTLLDSEKRFVNRIGVVFKPFYNYGKKQGSGQIKINGIKPFIITDFTNRVLAATGYSSEDSWIDNYKRIDTTKIGMEVATSYIRDTVPIDELQNMEYGFDLKIGKSIKNYMSIKLGTKENGKNTMTTFPVSVDKSDENQVNMATKAFLESHSENFELPEYFKDVDIIGLYLSHFDASGNRQMKTLNRNNNTVILDDYNWNDPGSVDLYVLVYSDDVYKENYKLLDWKRFPITTQIAGFATHGDNKLTNKDIELQDGCSFSSTLHYLGEYMTQGTFWSTIASRVWPEDDYQSLFIPDGIYCKNSTIPNDSFRAFLDVFQNKKFQDDIFAEIIKNENFVDKKYPLYVAKLSLKYKVPGQSNLFDGFRPLGKEVVPAGGYYEYSFKNIVTGGKSGVSITKPDLTFPKITRSDYDMKNNYKAKNNIKGNQHHPADFGLRICVKAPEDNTKNVAWEKANGGKALTKEQLKKWIVTDSKISSPQLDASATVFDGDIY